MRLTEPPGTRGEALNNDDSNLERVFADRKRTNILRSAEQTLIMELVKLIPHNIGPNALTFIGAIGSLIVFSAFLAATFVHTNWLLAGIAGLAINWFGDSLDGRLAYFRNTPRKWYGFALDIIMDWWSIAAIGFGYFIYAAADFRWLGFLFVSLYGWSILIALLRYKITDKYKIDSGGAGPTELRIIIALILLAEMFFKGLIHYSAVIISVTLFVLNLIDTLQLLKAGDERDLREKDSIGK